MLWPTQKPRQSPNIGGYAANKKQGLCHGQAFCFFAMPPQTAERPAAAKKQNVLRKNMMIHAGEYKWRLRRNQKGFCASPSSDRKMGKPKNKGHP